MKGIYVRNGSELHYQANQTRCSGETGETYISHSHCLRSLIQALVQMHPVTFHPKSTFFTVRTGTHSETLLPV
jgi:hypothetical protein